MQRRIDNVNILDTDSVIGLTLEGKDFTNKLIGKMIYPSSSMDRATHF